MKRFAWILFIAARHVRTRRRERGHTATVLSVAGIAAGVMTLVAVLAVMNGFQFGTIQDILEVGSFHLQVSAGAPGQLPAGSDALSAVEAALRISRLPGVRSAVPYGETYGLGTGYFTDPAALLLRAVPDDLLSRDPGLADRLAVVSGSFRIGDPHTIVIGEELARRMGVRVGDPVRIATFADASASVAAPPLVELEVSGVFRTGFLEYDAGWGYVSPQTGDRLGIRSVVVGVKLDDRFADRQASARISTAVPGASVASWRDYNRAIFGALRLEKTMMMLLIGLMFVVVGVNIYQSLRRSVVERTDEIGVLKALGARPAALQLVFVLEGVLIGLGGGSLGMMLGLAVSYNINAIFVIAESVVNALGAAVNLVASLVAGTAAAGGQGFAIFSPAYFYIDEVPAELVPSELVLIFLFALASASAAAWAASRRVSSVAPAEVLRDE